MAFSRHELQAGFRLGPHLIEPRQNRIVRADAEVRVEPRVMDVLVCLAERAGEVVTREALNQQVWGDVVVTEQAVTNCISELRQQLREDRAANRMIETIPKRGYRLAATVQLVQAEPPVDPAAPAAPAATKRDRRSIYVAAAFLFVGLVASAAWWWQSSPELTSIAVVRFENEAGDESLDYLSLALPDEIATLLTKSRDLAVRPFGYIEGDDPLAAARTRRVDHVVSGRYYVEDNGQLSLAIEAQHAAQERVIWRTRITAPAHDLLALRARIDEGVQRGLLPALGATAGSASVRIPVSDEAYRLYLHSLAIARQPQPTERAIELLEQAVTLDPAFAAAWDALGDRYYDHGTYGVGAESARQKSLAAHRRALELDASLISAARNAVIHHAEAGELEAAYAEARRLLERFGQNANAHFALGYVYRFGGMLEASQRHCEMALDLDPHDARMRSCAYSYLYAGRLARTLDFLDLDADSYFSQWGTVLHHLRTDDRDAALQIARRAADDPTRRLMEPCLAGANAAALETPMAEFITYWQRQQDPESAYAIAPMVAYCGRRDAALEFIERAVDGGFCSYPALDQDPMWAAMRNDQQFQRVRSKAMACHDGFRRIVEAHDVG